MKLGFRLSLGECVRSSRSAPCDDREARLDRLLFELAPALGLALLALSVGLRVAGLGWHETLGVTFGSLSFFGIPLYFLFPTLSWWWGVAGSEFFWALDDQEIVYGLDRSRQTMSWGEFGAWSETPEFFLIFLRTAPLHYHTLPRRAIDSVVQESLRLLLRERLGQPR